MPTGALSLPFRLQADRCQDSLAETKLLIGFDYRCDETSKFEAACVFALTASVAAAPVTFKSHSFRWLWMYDYEQTRRNDLGKTLIQISSTNTL